MIIKKCTLLIQILILMLEKMKKFLLGKFYFCDFYMFHWIVYYFYKFNQYKNIFIFNLIYNQILIINN
jgi:hypothetical protein